MKTKESRRELSSGCALPPWNRRRVKPCGSRSVTTGTEVPENNLESPDAASFDEQALLGSGRSVGALTREFVKLVDRLPTLLRSDSPKLQRIALDLFVDLALPEHIEMLMQGLEDEATRAVAIVALGRMPPSVVIPAVEAQLRERSTRDQRDPSEMVRRVCLLKALERLGEHGIDTLITHLDSEHLPERHQAASSLSNLGRQAARAHLEEVMSAGDQRGRLPLHARGDRQRARHWAPTWVTCAANCGSAGPWRGRMFRLLSVFSREARRPSRTIAAHSVAAF